MAQLKRSGKERFVATRKRIGKSLLHELAGAWGFMIFQEVIDLDSSLSPTLRRVEAMTMAFRHRVL